jgi:outer membrane protein assembly factor BamB
MGGYCDGCSSNSNIVQQIGLQGIDPPCVVCGVFTTPAVWEGHLYVSAVRDFLKSYEIRDGQLSATAVSASDYKIGFPGASPAVSARGATNGIVWVIDASLHGTPHGVESIDGKLIWQPKPGKKGPAVLRAYDALNLAKELWNSSQGANNRDQAGAAVKFSVPTVANGKVYVGTQNELTVYGLLPH